MADETGSLEATLAAVAGDDPELMRELLLAYRESVLRQFDLLKRSRCDGNWTIAAMRLRGLAASFHVSELLYLADAALAAAPGEPVVIRRLEAYLSEFSSI